MKKSITFFCLILLAGIGWAAPIDEFSARTVVQDFVMNRNGHSLNSVPASSGHGLRLVHAEVSSVNVSQHSYYIYNTGDGFVIVAGDDRAEPILGYGDGDFAMNNIPCALQTMLNSYKEQIDYLFEHPGLVVETPSMNALRLTASSVSPLLTSTWSQREPFNNDCPSTAAGRCVTGCACTSLCQVMYYWKYPMGATPVIPAYTTITNEIQQPELPSITFDWANMIDSYNGNYTRSQGEAVAHLMHYVGQAEEMDYDPNGSGAGSNDILNAAKMFGYNSAARVLTKADGRFTYYSDEQWKAFILQELDAGRPIVYCAADESTYAGHAFNVDGYDASTDRYHVNWGWTGSYDGYYALNAFDAQDFSFSFYQRMIVDLEPQYGFMEVSNTSLSFTAQPGETKTETFLIDALYLLSDLTVQLQDDAGVYAIDKTNITAEEAAYGAIVTVTYSPTTAGTSNAVITVSGLNVEPRTIMLCGTAVEVGAPEITTDVSAITIDPTYTGYEGSRTILITATNLSSDVRLSFSHDNTNSFGLSKYTITPEAAAAGALVTVYFYPMTGGAKHATLNITSDGAETVSIPVSGTGIKSDGYIFASPSNLSFETQVGTTVTKTFKVTYTYPNGSVMISRVDNDDETALGSEGSDESATLTFNAMNSYPNQARSKIIFDSIDWDIIGPIKPILLRGLVLELTGDDCFDITPKSIRLLKIPCSTYVTVTYNPDCVGEHDANIKIWLSFGSARPFNVSLHGTATAQLNAPGYGNDMVNDHDGASVTTDVNELAMNSRVYAEGQNVIIESPVEQTAVISDISGRARTVSLKAGRNEIPVNASGIYIVRIREKTTKLMLK